MKVDAVDVSSIEWRKSSRSGANTNCVEVGFVWRKSTFSGTNTDCVELARTPHTSAVRDSKNPDGPVLTFPFPAFTTALRSLNPPAGRA